MHVKNGDSRPISKNIQLFLIERKMTWTELEQRVKLSEPLLLLLHFL